MQTNPWVAESSVMYVSMKCINAFDYIYISINHKSHKSQIWGAKAPLPVSMLFYSITFLISQEKS